MSWKTRKDGRHFMERPRKKERYSRRSKSSLPSAGIKHNGSLTKLGYHLDATDETRHRALNESVEKYGYKKTIDKLAALEGVNKNHPTKHDRLKSDIKYLEDNHGPKDIRLSREDAQASNRLIGSKNERAQMWEEQRRKADESIRNPP